MIKGDNINAPIDTKSTSAKNVALMVHSCDRHSFLYRGFEYFFSKHWDPGINCNYYFATEDADASVRGCKNIKSGKGEWSDRLIRLLKENVKEDYILYFQERYVVE